MPAGNRILVITAMLFGLAVLVAALFTDGTVGKVAIVGAVVVAVVSVATRAFVPGTGRQRNRNRNRGTTSS
jgi:hypothetical protein